VGPVVVTARRSLAPVVVVAARRSLVPAVVVVGCGCGCDELVVVVNSGGG